MKIIDVTFDQLIANLCTFRGKEPKIGTMNICDVSIDDGKFLISATDGDKVYTMTITPPYEGEYNEEL